MFNIIEFLSNILGQPENELVEFKLADQDHDSGKIYQYVSALANEANLKSKAAGYLILWVDPKNHLPVGTNYRQGASKLQSLKAQVYQSTAHSVLIHEVEYNGARLIVLEIPNAPLGIVITANGHAWARENESLVALSDSKRDEIRNQTISLDWSAQIVQSVTIWDLNNAAINKARDNYLSKNSSNTNLLIEANDWSDTELLNRLGITIGWKITRAALLLLGKKESVVHLPQADARITWILKDEHGAEKDYMHFSPPFLLAGDDIFAKIRNLRYRYLQQGTLFPEEIDMYDPWIFRELLYNAIAHQDYSLNARISIVEYEDGRLIFENMGIFLPGNIEKLIESDTPPPYYRNAFLAKAMVETNMIDTIWSGIKRVFQRQRWRFFPMPTYSFLENRVKVELFWKILDVKYANILASRSDLTLIEIVALDKIQKGKTSELNKNDVLLLRGKWLIEWKYPNVYIWAEIARLVWKSEEYIKNRPMKDEFYKKKIEEYVVANGSINKKSSRELLLDMLPKVLSPQQKEAKIHNLMQSMKASPYNLIIIWGRKMGKWIQSNDKNNDKAIE